MTVKLVPKPTTSDEAIFTHATTAGCKPIWADGLLGWAWHCGCHVPIFNGDGPLPEIEDDEAIGLPEVLR